MDNIIFPEKLWIAFAICTYKCKNKEFIVDGSSQVCKCCGDFLFRIKSEKYLLNDNKVNLVDKKFAEETIVIPEHYDHEPVEVEGNYDVDYDESSIEWPEAVNVAAAYCPTEDMLDFIVDGSSSQYCQYCGTIMQRLEARQYSLIKIPKNRKNKKKA